jgi:two-component system, OmpR family, sensor histidine kinase PhoQ
VAVRLFGSLKARLLAVSSLVMLMFAAIAVGVLDNAFENAARDSVREHLNAQLYGLLTAAELTADGSLYFPERLAEPRFSVVDSGLYAFVQDHSGEQFWQSASAVSVTAPAPVRLDVGSMEFDLEHDGGGQPMFVLRFGVAWETTDGIKAFTFSIAEDLTRYRAQINAFRRDLYLWSAIGIGLLVILQLSILGWALRPLEAVVREVRGVEGGAQDSIAGEYPDEIAPLTRSINRLIAGNQRSLERYRNSLGDLAHSLKTPLAVLQGLSAEARNDSDAMTVLKEQIRRMSDIVDHQLKRASSSGGTAGTMWADMERVTERIVATMKKVYAERGISFETKMSKGLRVPMDEADLMEVLGNTVENACKWCHHAVAVRAQIKRRYLEIRIGDDGPGIDPGVAREVLRRGVRIDQQVPGQGIGLAVVRDIVDSYGGHVEIRASALGGAEIRIRVPHHQHGA